MRVVLFIMLILSLFSCERDNGAASRYNSSCLSIEPSIISSRSLIDDTEILSKEIGIFVSDLAGSATYPGCSNGYSIKRDNDSWGFYDGQIKKDVFINKQEARVFAYYPFSSNVVGFGQSGEIEMNISQSFDMHNQIDYLFADQSTTIDGGDVKITAQNYNVSLKMHHALAQIAFVFYKDGYSGDGVISEAKITAKSASPFRVSGVETTEIIKFKFEDKAIEGGKGVSYIEVTNIGSQIVLEQPPANLDGTFLDGFKNCWFLLPPPISTLTRSDMELLFVIDGNVFTASLSGGEFDIQHGYQYIFVIKLSPRSISVTNVALWNGVSFTELFGGNSDVGEGDWNSKDYSDNYGGSSEFKKEDWSGSEYTDDFGFDPWYGETPVTIIHTDLGKTITWAPVNCGYDMTHKYGLLYQWGRKYGQGYEGESPVVSLLLGPIDEATINHPDNLNNFYKNSSTPYDCITPQLNSWSMAVASNPCPAGWRVPSKEELTSLIAMGAAYGKTNNEITGAWFGPDATDSEPKMSLFFPMGGGRSYQGTTYLRIGGFGYYWTTNIVSTNAEFLKIESTQSSFTTSYRSSGLLIRCVKE